MSNYTYQVYLNSWRSFGGYEKLISNWDAASWNGLKNNFSKRQYNTKHDGVVTIEIDWLNPRNKALEQRELYKKSQKDIIKYYSELSLKELNKKLTCKAYVYSDKNDSIPSAIDYLKYFLYECFFVMNLSSPGSFNLYNSYIELETCEDNKNHHQITKENLSSSEYIFENALHDSFDFKWPVIQHLDLKRVLNWYLSQDIGIVQVGKTRVEKTLFSLLHISEKGMGPEALMWCAFCLESLYDTPNALSFNFLVRRISELLAVPVEKKKFLQKKFATSMTIEMPLLMEMLRLYTPLAMMGGMLMLTSIEAMFSLPAILLR